MAASLRSLARAMARTLVAASIGSDRYRYRYCDRLATSSLTEPAHAHRL